MKYKPLKENKGKTLSLDMFSGGIDAENEPTVTDDKCFKEAENCLFSGGKLCLRPTLRAVTGTLVGTEFNIPLTITDTAYNLNGEGCKIGYYSILDDDKETVYFLMVKKDGTRQRYGNLKFNLVSEQSPKVSNILFVTGPKNFSDGKGIYALVTRKSPLSTDVGIYEARGQNITWEFVEQENRYIPTIYKNGHGTAYESHKEDIYADVGIPETPEKANMLASYFKAYYTTDGYSYEFFLPVQNLDNNSIYVRYFYGEGEYAETTINGDDAGTMYLDGRFYDIYCDRETGRIFVMCEGAVTPLPYVLNYGRNNLLILASKDCTVEQTEIISSKFSTTFNSRFYVFNNSIEKNEIFSSLLTHPLYFPKNSKTTAGSAQSEITAVASQNGKLIVFKENETYKINVTSGTVLSKALNAIGTTEIYDLADKMESESISTKTGCLKHNVISTVGGRLIWLGRDKKVYTLEATTYGSEKNIYCISSSVDSILKNIDDQTLMSDGVFSVATDGMYILFLKDKVLVADCRIKEYGYSKKYASSESRENITWYQFTLPENTIVLSGGVIDGELVLSVKDAENDVCYFALPGSETDKVYTFSDDSFVTKEIPVGMHILSKTFTFGIPEQKKVIDRICLSVKNKDRIKFKVITDKEQITETLTENPQFKSITVKPKTAPFSTVKFRIESKSGFSLTDAKIFLRPVTI